MDEGLLLALTRDEVRPVFGAPDDEALWAAIEHAAAASALASDGRLLSCGGNAEGLHGAMLEARAASAGEAYPFDHAILGGRVLTKGQHRGCILLKRPDTVAHLAAALSALSETPFSKGFADAEAWFVALRDFYIRAAERKCAVVFVKRFGTNEA